MALLQLNVDDNLKKAIQKKAKTYGVPASSLIRIVLVQSFIEEEDEPFTPGNVFNADRDNNGKGIPIEDVIKLLEDARQAD